MLQPSERSFSNAICLLDKNAVGSALTEASNAAFCLSSSAHFLIASSGLKIKACNSACAAAKLCWS